MPADRFDRSGRQDEDASPEPAWHERTGTLAGASIAALVAIALVYFLISTVVRQFSEPDPAPGYYLDPGTTSSYLRTSYGPSSTTSETITPTSTPVTSDIDPGNTTTSSTDPSATSGTTSAGVPTTTEPSQLFPPSTRDPSRSRPPRFNQTRTVYPP